MKLNYCYNHVCVFFKNHLACEEEWRRLAASAAAETRLLSPGMQQIPNQIRAQQGTPLGNRFTNNFMV